MYKPGDIVCFNNIIFKDGVKDNKNNRPCIVISSFSEFQGEVILFCMPLTSNVKTFNKHPDRYALISQVLYNEKRLSFVKVDNLFLKNEVDAIDTGITISKENIDIIYRKISIFAQKEKEYALLDRLIKYQQMVIEKEKKRNSKIKKLKRKQEKKYIQNN